MLTWQFPSALPSVLLSALFLSEASQKRSKTEVGYASGKLRVEYWFFGFEQCQPKCQTLLKCTSCRKVA